MTGMIVIKALALMMFAGAPDLFYEFFVLVMTYPIIGIVLGCLGILFLRQTE